MKSITGKIPTWLKKDLKNIIGDIRNEIEVKFLFHRDWLNRIIESKDVSQKKIEQIYLSEDTANLFSDKLTIPKEIIPKEWRIRCINVNNEKKYKFTSKGTASKEGTKRKEYEKNISKELYDTLKSSEQKKGNLYQVIKTRYSYKTFFADLLVKVEVDDYHSTGKRLSQYDFITCEVEVPEQRLADVILNRKYFSKELQFLRQGYNLTGIKQFSNRKLAENGFVANSYDELIDWLYQYHLDNIKKYISKLEIEKSSDKDELFNNLKINIENFEKNFEPVEDELNSDDISLSQDVLSNLAFSVENSLGRKYNEDFTLSKFDQLGKGWLRDYQEIISANFYIRLSSKPQIFRPESGYSNTTTRGAHTSDVIATSVQLARQLGLNVELCMAIAALHDIGHPAGGHVGEDFLTQKSGRDFKHHIFSISLADIFQLNLLKEVQIGSFYHKSGGKELSAPKGRPQEFGVVRIADKISYIPWDLFDSIANGYLEKNKIQHLCDIMGNEPIDWIRNFINAVIKESAEAHQVKFTSKSGIIFDAYMEARKLLYTKVHPNINWQTLNYQMTLCYDKLEASFEDVDPVVVVGYMTDKELPLLTAHIESKPKSQTLNIEDLEKNGFGFIEIIHKMRASDFDMSNIYYSHPSEIPLDGIS